MKNTNEEQKRKAWDALEALIDEGIASGESTELTKQDFEDIRRELHIRHARRQEHKSCQQ